MGKKTKSWLIAAGVLMLLGCVVFVIEMTALRWDFKKLSTVQYETTTYTFCDEFEKLTIETDTADIRILPAADGKCTVMCTEEPMARHTVMLEDGTLTVCLQDEKAWYDYIGISFESPVIMVYVPREAYNAIVIRGSTSNVNISDVASEKLTIQVSTGDIHGENIGVGTLDLTVTTGDVILTNVQCTELTSHGSTGNIDMHHVVAAGQISIQRTTGDVRFDGCDAAALVVHVGTGDVTGSLLTDKIFRTKASTGDVDVPATTTGGVCEITTSTGDVRITIK